MVSRTLFEQMQEVFGDSTEYRFTTEWGIPVYETREGWWWNPRIARHDLRPDADT